MRGEIRRYFRDFGWTIRPPRSVQEMQSKIIVAEGELFQALGRSPRPSEIAAHLDVELDLVVDSLAANGCFAPMSSTRRPPRARAAPSTASAASTPAFDNAEARITLGPLLRDLTRRERKILEMRFFGGATQAEIGAEVGVTQMQVSRLLSRLLGRLRKRLEADAAAVGAAGPVAGEDVREAPRRAR